MCTGAVIARRRPGLGPDASARTYFDDDDDDDDEGDDDDDDGDMRDPVMIGGVPLPKTNEPPTVSMTTLRTREGMKPLS
jgi:hypothetical protein